MAHRRLTVNAFGPFVGMYGIDAAKTEEEKPFKLGDKVEIIGHVEWLRRLEEYIKEWATASGDYQQGEVLKRVHALGLKDGDFYRYITPKRSAA